MADDKIRLPSGMGGLISYSEDSFTKIHFKPGVIVIFIILIILIEIFLHTYGKAWLG